MEHRASFRQLKLLQKIKSNWKKSSEYFKMEPNQWEVHSNPAHQSHPNNQPAWTNLKSISKESKVGKIAQITCYLNNPFAQTQKDTFFITPPIPRF